MAFTNTPSGQTGVLGNLQAFQKMHTGGNVLSVGHLHHSILLCIWIQIDFVTAWRMLLDTGPNTRSLVVWFFLTVARLKIR